MILSIHDFQIAYPYLWKAINAARVESGSNGLDEDYSTSFSIPIRMHDAALADRFLEKESKGTVLVGPDDSVPNPVVLGYLQLKRIMGVVKSEPNMLRWLDKLYFKENPKGLYSDRYKKKTKTKKEVDTMARNNVVTGEIIALVEKSENDTFKAYHRDTSEDLTDKVNNQKKLKYAYDNRGCIRGRIRADDSIVWRVVKERFVREDEIPVELI